MNYRITLGLLIVAIALGATVYALDSNPATPTPAAKPTTVLSFLSVDTAEITASGQGKTTSATRDAAGAWMLTKPEAAPADRVRLDSLIARLSALTAARTIPDANAAEFGLASPRAELRLKTRAGQEFVLLVGDDTPDKSSAYVKLPDNPTVFIVQSNVTADVVRLITEPPKATPTPTVVVPNLTPLPTVAKPSGSPSAPAASATAIVPVVIPPTGAPAATETPAASATPKP